jgi:hypothetical protein
LEFTLADISKASPAFFQFPLVCYIIFHYFPFILYVSLPSKYVSFQMLMFHTGNPSYSEGRDQQDHALKPAQEIVLETLSQKKKKSQERAGRMA